MAVSRDKGRVEKALQDFADMNEEVFFFIVRIRSTMPLKLLGYMGTCAFMGRHWQ